MSMDSSRADKAHEISYPASADKRGSTRVNHRRRPYYLGPHDSPASYVMFGLWKHRLLETGEAPSTKELRPIVQSLLSQQPLPEPVNRKWKWISASVVLSTTVLAIAMVVAVYFASRPGDPTVDELVLSETETEIIRGIRAQKLGFWQKANDESASIAALTVKFMDEGSANGLQHIPGQNF